MRSNSPEAIAEAIGLLQQTVFSFSMKMCGHREDAEDTSQDVLFSSLKHLPKLQNPSALAAWLYTVTRNRCHRMRAAVADSPARKLSLNDLMPDEAELSQLLVDSAPSPEGKLLRAEQGHLLHQALQRLPTPLRLVLVLHDMEELETGLVAQILNLQLGTVRVRLHRARLALRKEMARIVDRADQGAPAIAGKSASSRAGKPATRSKKCRELFASLSEYLDGHVGPKTCDEMSAHIVNCPACVAFLRDLRAAIDRCRTMEVTCDPAVTSRLQTMLTKEYLVMMGGSVATKESAEI